MSETQNLGNLGHVEILCSFVFFFLKYNNKNKIMSKRKFSGRYLPLALGAAQLAYRTMRGNPRGAVRVRRCPNTRRRTRVPQRRFVRQRIKIHQGVRQTDLCRWII